MRMVQWTGKSTTPDGRVTDRRHMASSLVWNQALKLQIHRAGLLVLGVGFVMSVSLREQSALAQTDADNRNDTEAAQREPLPTDEQEPEPKHLPDRPQVAPRLPMNLQPLLGRPPRIFTRPAQPRLLRSDQDETVYPPVKRRERKPVNPDEVRGWVEDLNDNNFRRRESVTQKLIDAGPGAVKFLIPALDSGELELTHRVIKILHEIALTEDLNERTGAWTRLQELAEEGTGSRRSRSLEAIDEIREYRSGQAKRVLKSAGVFVGTADFIVQATSTLKEVVQIDEDWNGDMQALEWLRWLRGVEYARVRGTAIRADVLQKLSQTSKLKTIALVDGTITPEVLHPLKQMSAIYSMEIRYIDLGEEMVRPIIDLPIRYSLSMKGTGISKESVQAMREAMPGLEIDFNEGGFLGVTCHPQLNNCQIQSVIPGSAADEAGLMVSDVVVGIDDEPVTQFKDLQTAIGTHFPGDEVKVKFLRNGNEESVTVKLGAMTER